MTRAELLALADRVEAGEAGWEIDAAVWRAVGWEVTRLPRAGWRRRIRGHPSEHHWQMVPGVVTSIDAQRMLPGRIYRVQYVHTDEHAWRWEAHAGGVAVGRAPTEPAARLAAILRAMAEKEPEA